MKKTILALLCATFAMAVTAQTIPMDSRIVKGCGYMTNEQAVLAAKQTTINAADERLGTLLTNKMPDGTYCFWQVVDCTGGGFPPLPSAPAHKPYDTRRLSKCGFASEYSALQAVTSVFLNEGETATSCVERQPNGTYCYEIIITCGTPLEPAPRAIPALRPMQSCTKTLYGPDWFNAYPSCQEAENGAAAWLAGKTSIILESVTTGQWGSGPDWEMWKVTITYTTGGACYK